MKILFEGHKHSNEKGILLISFVLITALMAIGVLAFYTLGFANYQAALRSEYYNQAFYLAEAGIDLKVVELSARNTDQLVGTVSVGGQSGSYSVTHTLDANTGEESLVSVGTVQVGDTTYSRTVRATVEQFPVFVPNAAVYVSGEASTNGNISVDGRDHDINGNLNGQPGLPGIATATAVFNQGGNSKVGGNGIAPAKPADPVSYELNTTALPSTPEKILGLSDGALDSYKSTTPPETPFNGIVYMTESWTAVNLDGSTGILICHNSDGDALLKNIHGKFTGLLITDDIIHINGDAELIGAVLGLSSGGVTLGNGSAEVKYSGDALANLPYVRYEVTSWEDGRND